MTFKSQVNLYDFSSKQLFEISQHFVILSILRKPGYFWKVSSGIGDNLEHFFLKNLKNLKNDKNDKSWQKSWKNDKTGMVFEPSKNEKSQKYQKSSRFHQNFIKIHDISAKT